MRLIDANALMEVFRGDEGADALDHFALRLIKVKRVVDNAPTIDAIPVGWLIDRANDPERAPLYRRYAQMLYEEWRKEQEAR